MNIHAFISKKTISYLIVLFVLAGLLTTITVIKQTQIIKQRAAENPTQPATRPVLGTLYDGDARGQQLTINHFNSINMLTYMSITQPQRGQFDFSGDSVIAFAQAHHLLVHAHPLIYQWIIPDWISQGVASGTLTKTDMENILIDHVRTLVTHYKGKVYSWDVINELVDYDGNFSTQNNNVWLRSIGPDYAKIALRTAREADPNAKLYINGIPETINSGSNKMFDLIKQYQQEGVPLDGVGFESHYGYFGPVPSVSDVQNNMRRFENLGLDIAMSEFDIFIKSPITQSSLDSQAQQYRNFAQLCKDEPRCVRFTTWGISDKDTWYQAIGATADPAINGAPLPFDSNYQAKPAFFALQSVMNIPAPLPTQEPTPTTMPTATNTPVSPLSPTIQPTLTQSPILLPTNTLIPSQPVQAQSTPTPNTTTSRTSATPPASQAPTSVLPGKTYLSLTVFLHGIGSGGDSQSPTSSGNQNPLHSQKEASVEIFSLTGNQLGEKNIFLSYKKDAGNFQAIVPLDDTITPGTYQIKVKADLYLKKAQILTLQTGTVNTLPSFSLIAGDINNDNILSLLDYNIMRGCISLLEPAKNCTGNAQVDSDLTDDGKVEAADRTLFIRELTNFQGD